MGLMKKMGLSSLLAVFAVFLLSSSGLAYEINDKLSIGGIIAGEWQYQNLSDDEGFDSEGKGAMVFQPEIGFTPTDSDELFASSGSVPETV